MRVVAAKGEGRCAGAFMSSALIACRTLIAIAEALCEGDNPRVRRVSPSMNCAHRATAQDLIVVASGIGLEPMLSGAVLVKITTVSSG